MLQGMPPKKIVKASKGFGFIIFPHRWCLETTLMWTQNQAHLAWYLHTWWHGFRVLAALDLAVAEFCLFTFDVMNWAVRIVTSEWAAWMTIFPTKWRAKGRN